MSEPLYGNKQYRPYAPLYPTPEDLPLETACLSISLPNNPAWTGLVYGVLLTLTDPESYQVLDGGLDREVVADVFNDVVIDLMLDPEQCRTVPTPFWDEAQDLDDEMPADDQIWYGEVDDPEAPPEEITFIDNAAIWLITGFVAYAGDIGAAIFFHTIAPRFVLAWKRGDVGEIIRVIIDSADYGTVDTGTVDVGEIVQLNVLPDPELESHDILLVKVS